MSKIITLNPVAGSTITFTNTFSADKTPAEFLPLTELQTVKDNERWNTGCAMLGDPHIDEMDNDGKILLTDPNAFESKHIASIRLYKSNSYVYLLPGDSLTITARSSEEALYYFEIKSELLKVECNFITKGEDRPETEVDYGPYLDRTTGIGDSSSSDFVGGNTGDGEEGGEVVDPGSADPVVDNP